MKRKINKIKVIKEKSRNDFLKYNTTTKIFKNKKAYTRRKKHKKELV